MGGNFKFQVQDSFLKYFFGDCEIVKFGKTNRTFWKKNTFTKIQKPKKSTYQIHVEVFGGMMEVGEVLETYHLDGLSQLEAANLVDIHPGMVKNMNSIIQIFHPAIFCLLAVFI